MLSAVITVKNPTGIHARPAVELIKLAKNFKSKIFLQKGERKANCISIMEVMALGAAKDSELLLITDGSDENEALIAVRKYIDDLKE